MWEEKLSPISDIRVGDMVMGSDGAWHAVVETHASQRMHLLKLVTDRGYVCCGYQHEWSIWSGNLPLGNFHAGELASLLDTLEGLHIGAENGPKLVAVEEAGQGDAACITTDAKDHQFEILLKTDGVT